MNLLTCSAVVNKTWPRKGGQVHRGMYQRIQISQTPLLLKRWEGLFISSVWLPWGKIRFEKLHINDILSLLTLLSSPFLALSCINLLTQAKHWLSATSNFQANFFRQSTERSDNYLIFEMRWMAIYRWLCQPSSLSKGLLFALSKSQWLMQVRRLDAMSYNNNTRLGSWHKQKLQTLFTR